MNSTHLSIVRDVCCGKLVVYYLSVCCSKQRKCIEYLYMFCVVLLKRRLVVVVVVLPHVF